MLLTAAKSIADASDDATSERDANATTGDVESDVSSTSVASSCGKLKRSHENDNLHDIIDDDVPRDDDSRTHQAQKQHCDVTEQHGVAASDHKSAAAAAAGNQTTGGGCHGDGSHGKQVLVEADIHARCGEEQSGKGTNKTPRRESSKKSCSISRVSALYAILPVLFLFHYFISHSMF